MSEVGVRRIIGRLISDPHFAAEFKKDPSKAIETSGYAVTPSEHQALLKIKPGDLKVNIHKVGGEVASFDVSQGVKTV